MSENERDGDASRCKGCLRAFLTSLGNSVAAMLKIFRLRKYTKKRQNANTLWVKRYRQDADVLRNGSCRKFEFSMAGGAANRR
jgi:hypothetical protein